MLSLFLLLPYNCKVSQESLIHKLLSFTAVHAQYITWTTSLPVASHAHQVHSNSSVLSSLTIPGNWQLVLSCTTLVMDCCNAVTMTAVSSGDRRVQLDAEHFEWTVHAGRSNECSVLSETDAGRQRSVVVEHFQLLPLLAHVHPATHTSLVTSLVTQWARLEKRLTLFYIP